MTRIFVTDCEGPLTTNDNALEIAERFIPDGGDLFARLSRYDDFLADIAHRPDYNAGDTLRLLPPFLKAYEVTDADVELFSAEGVLMVPGALAMLDEVQLLMPAFIISTSYTPYIRALCDLTGFPEDHVRCTALHLDAWHVPRDEKSWLREQAELILDRELVDIPDGATGVNDLSRRDRETVARLDDLFWEQLPSTVCGDLVAGVHPVGGGMKLLALEEIVAGQGVHGDDVIYVGDSITDAPPLARIKEWGGLSLSFNGNTYALAAAEVAAASPDADVVGQLAAAFHQGGRAAALATVATWPRCKKGVRPTGKERARVGLVAEEPEALAEASAASRLRVRGERIARLG
jgi:predicted HAD superfamily phosphohydrolase